MVLKFFFKGNTNLHRSCIEQSKYAVFVETRENFIYMYEEHD